MTCSRGSCALSRSDDLAENFALYNREAAALQPGQNRLVAIDWWNGNRVPLPTRLARLIAGFDLSTSAVDIYRALMDSLCFGARGLSTASRTAAFREACRADERLAKSNPFLLQIMADVLGRTIFAPEIDNATCVGAAIYGAVAAGVAADFRDGGERFGARQFGTYQPEAARAAASANCSTNI